MGFFNYFTTIMVLSFFYSFMITGTTYALYDQGGIDLGVVTTFESTSVNVDYASTSQDFQDSINTQNSFGLVDLGALALYSGNIVLDLASNFLFAFPSMISVLFTGLFYIIKPDVFLQQEILTFSKAILSVISAIFLLKFLLGARTQTTGAF